MSQTNQTPKNKNDLSPTLSSLNLLKELFNGFQWLEKYDSQKNTYGLIPYFFKDLQHLFPNFEFIFLKHLTFQKTLALTYTTLQNKKDLIGKAFHFSHFNSLDKENSDTLKHPLKNKELTLFLKHQLKKKALTAFPMEVLNEVKGLLVVIQKEKVSPSSNSKHSEPQHSREAHNLKENKKSFDLLKNIEEIENQIDVLKMYCTHSVKILSSIFERKFFQTRLHNLDYEEKFSFILKKTSFLDQLEKEFSRARRIHHPLSLALISIDEFFQFRNTMSHKKALLKEEKALQFLSLILRKCFRTYDIFGRLNTSEFGILLPHTSKENGLKALKRLLSWVKGLDFSRFIGEKDEKLTLDLSAGISEYPSHCHSPEEMIQLADQALYQAKKQTLKKICLSISLYENFKPDFISTLNTNPPKNQSISSQLNT